MGSSSSVMRPQELIDFRKLNTSIENIDLPARPESRRLTDRKGFIIYGVALLFLLPFLIYCLVKSDLRHTTHGADGCGNFCGYKNEKIDGIECSGEDYTDLPYLDAENCVASCPNGQFAGICFHIQPDNQNLLGNPYNTHRYNNRPWTESSDVFSGDDNNYEVRKTLDIQEAFQESGRQWWKFLFTIIITIALAILTLVLLRYTPAPLVWGIVIFSMVVLVLITIGAWVVYMEVSSHPYPIDRNPSSGLFVLAIGWTIIATIILTVFIVLFKKISLVIQLYKEATKVLAAMPMIVFVPILFAILQIIVLVIGCVTTYFMVFSRELVKSSEDVYGYQTNGVVVFTIIYNLIILSWSMRIIAGIQFMIVSGSASTWYFSKNKDYLDSPICTNFKITFRYHLGTIVFGSFLLTLFSVVKAILRATFRNACCRCAFVICCNNVEIVLKFLSENSYIQTGIHGQSFLRSAKRATKLLIANAASVIAINCVGDFVLGVIIFLVSVISTAISYAMFSNMAVLAIIPTLICFVVNIILVAIVFSCFSTIIDTLFICFCEDSILNDGISRPYYMSTGLMEFVENSKKIYGKDGR